MPVSLATQFLLPSLHKDITWMCGVIYVTVQGREVRMEVDGRLAVKLGVTLIPGRDGAVFLDNSGAGISERSFNL